MPEVVKFEEWTQGRPILSLSTNSGAPQLPFQSWRRFKEAFAPELVAHAIEESEIPVKSCLDPFGGSGTAALACQFLGVHPITIEVNPFLADLIEAKLSSYNLDALARDFGTVLRSSRNVPVDLSPTFQAAPKTFVEPGINGRWIFDYAVAIRIDSLRKAIDLLTNASHQRLFRALLGGILIEVSNVVVSGKGRRYRKGWDKRPVNAQQVDHLFCESTHRAIEEISRYSRRACMSYKLLRGDSRQLLDKSIHFDLVVSSPPYPNSFDYTDVYNVELWALGYLGSRDMNQNLRRSTMCSHVQIDRPFPPPPETSALLGKTLRALSSSTPHLWDPRIPGMVGGYFADLSSILGKIKKSLTARGKLWMVVGDSRYGGIQIETAQILGELASAIGYKLEGIEPFRSMRSSAQQGGRHELAESLVMLSNC